jgi:hypothetical protein
MSLSRSMTKAFLLHIKKQSAKATAFAVLFVMLTAKAPFSLSGCPSAVST